GLRQLPDIAHGVGAVAGAIESEEQQPVGIGMSPGLLPGVAIGVRPGQGAVRTRLEVVAESRVVGPEQVVASAGFFAFVLTGQPQGKTEISVYPASLPGGCG